VRGRRFGEELHISVNTALWPKGFRRLLLNFSAEAEQLSHVPLGQSCIGEQLRQWSMYGKQGGEAGTIMIKQSHARIPPRD